MKKILIIAGEASSDLHAANLVNDIKALDNDIGFFGLGGDNMKSAGVDLRENIAHLAFIGPGGLFNAFFKLKKIYNSLCRHLTENRPDCAILIDYAEFNLRVARHLKELGVPVIYYISPQVWAWGLWRIKSIKKLVDKVLVFFRFEEKLYREHEIDVSFVGHPFLDIVKATETKEDIRKRLNLNRDKHTVAILPGSRKSEIKNILPVMLESCDLIHERLRDTGVEFILPLAPTLEEESVSTLLANHDLPVKVVKDYTHNALSVCDCAIVASGSATLETALLGVPMAIVYKANFLTCLFTKSVIKLPYIGLVNVVAGEKVVSEFLQDNATPKDISSYIVRLLEDKSLSDVIKEKFIQIRKDLGEPGASRNAAREVVEFLEAR